MSDHENSLIVIFFNIPKVGLQLTLNILTLNSYVPESHIWNPAPASRRPVRRSPVIIFETITYQKGVGKKGERERKGEWVGREDKKRKERTWKRKKEARGEKKSGKRKKKGREDRR